MRNEKSHDVTNILIETLNLIFGKSQETDIFWKFTVHVLVLLKFGGYVSLLKHLEQSKPQNMRYFFEELVRLIGVTIEVFILRIGNVFSSEKLLLNKEC